MSPSLNYREMLLQELEKRCRRNSQYSLRSFARDLSISPSRLSDVLKGRYGLSRAAAEKIAKKMQWEPIRRTYFCDLVASVHSRSRTQKKEARKRLKRLYRDLHSQQLSLDAFQLISDWYHYAILELTLTEDFQSDTAWISQRLAVNEHLIESAIQRLIRLGLLEKKNNTLKATAHNTFTPSGIPNEAIRKNHRQILQKAQAALDSQTVDQRDFSSVVLAIRKKDLPEAQEAIKAFRRQFDTQFGQSIPKDEVYCLAIQFFSLSQTTH